MLCFPFWPRSLLVWSQYLIGWCPMTQCNKKICYGVLFNPIYYSLYLKTFICWCYFELKLNRIMLNCYHFRYQLAIGYNFSLLHHLQMFMEKFPCYKIQNLYRGSSQSLRHLKFFQYIPKSSMMAKYAWMYL